MKRIILETERLRLYVASQAEMKQFIEKETNDELIKAYQEMLDGYLAHPEQGEWYAIWMVTRHDGVQVGDLSFKGLNKDGSVEIGYGIKAGFQGRGYATEAVTAAVDWALKQVGVLRVEAEAEPDNTASQRVLAKCDFVPNGIIGKEGPRFVRMHNQWYGRNELQRRIYESFELSQPKKRSSVKPRSYLHESPDMQPSAASSSVGVAPPPKGD